MAVDDGVCVLFLGETGMTLESGGASWWCITSVVRMTVENDEDEVEDG